MRNLGIIILLGPPGVGKGTQARLLGEKLNYKPISTGQIIRESIASGGELGKKVAEIINKGHLAPDELMIKIIQEFLEKNHDTSGFIFDGYPRTVKQAELLDSLLDSDYMVELKVFNLTASNKELVKRLMRRTQIEKRKDDTPETIKIRFEVYNKQTVPVLNYYKTLIKVVDILGEGKIEHISNKIFAYISNQTYQS